MATVYGDTKLSAWRSVLTYSLVETDTTLTIRITKVGAQCVGKTYSIDGTGSSGCNFKETITGMSASSMVETSDFRDSGFYGTSYVYTEQMYLNCPIVKTINKTSSTQTVNISYAVNISKFYRTNNNTGVGKEYSNYTSTATATITVPALATPNISFDIQRKESDNFSVDVNVVINSFSGDVISQILLKENTTTLSPTWSPSLPITSTGQPITLSTTITVQSEDTIPFSINCTGTGGTSATINKSLSSAFYIIDVQAGGKEIAFGAPATDDVTNYPKGLFKCDMTQIARELVINGVNLNPATAVSSNSGKILIGDVMILWGQEQVTTDNTYTATQAVNFSTPFRSNYTPAIMTTFYGGWIDQANVSVYSRSNEGFTIYARITDEQTTRTVGWLAIGLRA